MTMANSAERALPLPRAAGPATLVSSVYDYLGHLPLGIIQLLARLAVAGVFWRSGMVKIASWQQTVALFQDEYQVPLLPPEIAAYFGTAVELACPVLLFFGLASRLGALGLLGMTFVIEVFVYPNNWPEHLTWATLLLIVLTRGPGPVSLDHLIKTRLFNR
jgi:putative oxidoreductase